MVLPPALAEYLLFQPSRGDPGEPPPLCGIPGRGLNLTTSDKVRIQAWWYEVGGKGGAPAVLFLHGNAGDISHRTPMAEGLVKEGISVLLLEYRGYGGSGGRPSEEGLHLDSLAGYDFLLDQVGISARIVVLGRSMGGAVAARLATVRTPGGVILESAFTSLEAMARTLYPFLPSFLFSGLRGRWSTIDGLREGTAPLLVIHGTIDDLVPPSMGEALLEAGQSRARWLGVEGAGHNDVFWVGGESYFRTVGDFVKECARGEPQG